jgi:hypothetical protein
MTNDETFRGNIKLSNEGEVIEIDASEFWDWANIFSGVLRGPCKLVLPKLKIVISIKHVIYLIRPNIWTNYMFGSLYV